MFDLESGENSKVSIDLDRIGAKLERGGRLEPADIDALIETHDLLSLGTLADTRRRALHGNRATFVRVAEVPADGDLGSQPQIPEAAGEVRIVGHPTDLDQAVMVTQQVVAAAGGTPVTGFALDELEAMSGGDSQRLVEALMALRSAGLALIAEARVARLNGTAVLDIVSRAELRVARLTLGDPTENALTLVRQIVAWGSAVASVYAFVPLPQRGGSQSSTGYRDVRQVALARLLVDNIVSIQVDWSLHGPKLAQVALTFGANDVDAVSSIDSMENGWRRSPLEEIKRNISAAALVPVQRNGRFETLEAEVG